MAASIVPPPNDIAAAPPTQARCPNCGSAQVDAFCAQCGEAQLSHRDLSLRSVAHDAVQEFAGVDGKVPRTVWALVTTPGLLTREFIDGRRGRYSKPLSLFLILNLVFFLIQPYTGLLRYDLANYIGGADDVSDSRSAVMVQRKLAETGESRASYEARFDRTLSDHKKSMLLFAVPVFAMGMLVLFAGTRRYFVEHLVFSVHVYAFFLAFLAIGVTAVFTALGGFLSVGGLLGLPVRKAGVLLGSEPVLVTVIMVTMTWYLTLAIQRAYGGTRRKALARALALSFLQMSLIKLYHDVLFFTAFFAT
jgi:hypothetical protein